MLSVRFWGVRGSIPCPGPDTVIYGGNTSCIEIRADERLIIIDLGTGARPLGDWLAKNDLQKYKKIKADIFVTHTHWDHIMGFPMFTPIYIPGTELRITGPASFEEDNIKNIFEEQLSYKYWPVRIDELAAKIEYNQIKETELDLGGGISVTSKFLNHPVFCLGYRFGYQGKSVAIIFDHEPFRNLFSLKGVDDFIDEETMKEGEAAASEENDKIIKFLKYADIVIHDTQYTVDEYQKKTGWGHASYDHAVHAALAAEAKKLVFYHHDPAHTDSQLEHIENDYADCGIQCIMAKEGITLEV